MARIEKAVFISYRRKDISWALAVYQYLTSQKYDVFFDFNSIPSGDFDQIILSNIRARAHFILILTPTALDRCSQPGDWLRREIETALQEKRNIIPLFFEDFSFGSPSVAERLTGALSSLPRYNGLNIPSGYFTEAMERLRTRYLNVPLDAVLHPMPDDVQQVVRAQQSAANTAALQRRAIEDRVKKAKQTRVTRKNSTNSVYARYAIGAGIFAALVLAMVVTGYLLWNVFADGIPGMAKITLSPTLITRAPLTATPSPTPITPLPPTDTPSPVPDQPVTIVMPEDGMTLVYVPAGDFQMGSNDGKPDEQPVHAVYVEAFWIDQTEVTNAMFEGFIQKTGYVTDAEKAGNSWAYIGESWEKVEGATWNHPLGPSSDISAIMNHPVVHVSWNDALEYCFRQGGRRLPTEAEWEKAASWDNKNQQKFVYSWGNLLDCSLANYMGQDGACVGGTTPVGRYESAQSPYGLFDMTGNVWEFTSSLYSPYPYNATDGREDLSSKELRALRGGSWFQPGDSVRSAARTALYPSNSAQNIGFRCARTQ